MKCSTCCPTTRAIKGGSAEGVPILGPSSFQDIDWRGRKKKHGVKLWRVGVDTAKDLLLGQLGILEPGPGSSTCTSATNCRASSMNSSPQSSAC